VTGVEVPQRSDSGQERTFRLGDRVHRLAPLGLAAVALAVVIDVVVLPTLRLPWWANTEEFPYAQEVVRFLHGDIHQRFFDIPGTPLMFVAAVIFALPRWFLSLTSGQHGFGLFSEQMEVLAVIMRLLEVVAFAVSVVLVYLTARRLMSRWAAGFAAAVLATSPVLYTTLGYTRIEAMGVLLVAAGIYVWVRALESRAVTTFLAAGFLAGLAMAARFPLGLATLPAFLLQAAIFPGHLRPSRLKPVLTAVAAAYAAIVVVGGALSLGLALHAISRDGITDAYFISSDNGTYPHAWHVIRSIWIFLGAAVVLIAVAGAVPTFRGWLRRRLEGPLLPLVVAFPLGVVVGVPTLWVGSNWFLASIDNFIQRNHAYPRTWTAFQTFSLDLFGSGGARSILTLKAPAAEPGALFSPILVVCFCLGVLACFTHRRQILPFVALAIPVGLVAQLGKIEGSRHIAGWLPWFALVCGLGFELATRVVPGRHREVVQAGVAFALIALLLIPVSHFAAPINNHTIEKLPAQRKLNAWIANHVSRSSPILEACCTSADASAIANWMRQNGVDVPPPRDTVIWFGQRSVVTDLGRGFVVVDRLEYGPAYVAYYQHSDPSEVVDPYHNADFKLVAHYPYQASSIDMFRFDYTRPRNGVPGGIHIVEATYGPPGLSRLKGNQTAGMEALCNGRRSCSVIVTFAATGDPAPGVAKQFQVVWTCGDRRRRVRTVGAEALGKTTAIACPRPQR
jgi:Dolichyl-phosphate-mannose-protein mannosyltransferase